MWFCGKVTHLASHFTTCTLHPLVLPLVSRLELHGPTTVEIRRLAIGKNRLFQRFAFIRALHEEKTVPAGIQANRKSSTNT